ncbi:MAG: hypothetical protein N2Z80_04185 [Hydrogenothermaceae bacterium]|nr:hypothetical protein [Hydrogenothermaceae bacterium]
MKKISYILLVSIFLTFGYVLAKTKKEQKQEKTVDQLQLPSLLIKDEHYDRAIEILKEINPQKVDTKRYYTLFGYALYKMQNFKDSASNFEKAYSYGATDKNIITYIVDSYYKQKDCRKTVEWIDKEKEVTSTDYKFYLIKVECLKNLSDYDGVLSTIDEALKKFTEEKTIFYKLKFYTYMELRLYFSAMEVAEILLSQKGATPEDYVAISKALYQNGEYKKSIFLLEKAYFIFGDDEKILVSLANSYYKIGMLYNAAYFFEKASKVNPNYYKDAAEVYKRIGRYDNALTLNSMIQDGPEKLRQRIGILIDMKRYSQVLGLEDIIKVNQLDKDDNIKYAIAYCAFMSGRLEKSEDYLKQIKDDNVYKKSVQLLQIISRCKVNREYCYQEET